MPTAQGHVATARPSRYLVQLCNHANKIGSARGHRRRAHAGSEGPAFGDVQVSADWSETRGTISFTPWGQCTIQATLDALTLHVEATDDYGLRRIQDIIARDFDRIGRRDKLTVDWRRPETPGGEPGHEPEVEPEEL
ncbi:MAG: DUF2218 domain-containing protein [Jatrophihabitantaceae bacterium]